MDTRLRFAAVNGGMPVSIISCAEAAPLLAAEYTPGEALAKWLQRYAAFIATKRGLAPALHSGNPAFEPLRAYFEQRVRPALRTLLRSAVAAGEVRYDVESDDLLQAVASLCMPAQDDDRARRLVALLIDGLRYGTTPSLETPTWRTSSADPLPPRPLVASLGLIAARPHNG